MSILDEEYESMDAWWLKLPIAQRVEVCREYGISIFAARWDEYPEDLYQYRGDLGFI